jgi:rhodanese-related sulfurtransferase
MSRNERSALSRLGGMALLGVFLVTEVACATGRRVMASLTSNCHEIEAGVANEMIRDNPGILLLDVREDRDYTADLPHLRKAREIPLPDLPRRYRELAAWKKESIVIFSRDGTDAASACEFLSRQEFPYVSYVAVGMSAWMQGGYGRPSGRP